LRGDPRRPRPRVARATCDHRDECRGARDGQRSGRAASGRPFGTESVEEVVEPQFQVVLGLQSRTSLRRH
jgi:hypothetical protein